MTRSDSPTRVPPLLVAVATILLVVPALFHDTTAAMLRVWLSNETYTHGFLILPISLWLIWQNRERLMNITPQADFRALILLIPCLLGWLLATLVDVQLVRQLGLIALLPITVWLICGLPTVMTLLFPLLYLFFAVPIGQSLIPALMEFTADFTVYGVRAVGIPVFREGLSFSLPTGNWVVVEECSGLRYLIASAALGTIYAYLSYRSYLKRSLFILAALVTPIIANGVRAWLIVMVGHLSDMRYAVGLDHLLYGWVFFGLVMALLFYVGSLWADTQAPAQAPSAAPAQPTGRFGKREAASVTIAVALLAGINLFTRALTDVSDREPANISLPATVGSWQNSVEDAVGKWAPIYQNPTQTLAVTYGQADDTVTLHVGYFTGQAANSDPVSSLNRLTDPYSDEWRLLRSQPLDTAGIRVTEARVRGIGGDLLVWQVWAIAGHWSNNPYIAKLHQVSGLVLEGRRDGAYIAVATPYLGDEERARGRLTEFWDDAQTALGDVIGDAANAEQ